MNFRFEVVYMERLGNQKIVQITSLILDRYEFNLRNPRKPKFMLPP